MDRIDFLIGDWNFNKNPKNSESKDERILVLLSDYKLISADKAEEVHYLRPRIIAWTYYTIDIQ